MNDADKKARKTEDRDKLRKTGVDRERERESDEEIGVERCREKERKRERQRERQTDRLTNRQIDRLTERQTDRQTDRQNADRNTLYLFMSMSRDFINSIFLAPLHLIIISLKFDLSYCFSYIKAEMDTKLLGLVCLTCKVD